MANIDIKYGFIVNLMSTLAIGKFDNKKGILFIFYQQTSNFKMKTTNQKVSGGQSDRGTK
jgi:hypothetical protein